MTQEPLIVLGVVWRPSLSMKKIHAVPIPVCHRETFNMGPLTDGGDEFVKSLPGEERILQTSKVQLKDTSHGVHVVVVLLVS